MTASALDLGDTALWIIKRGLRGLPIDEQLSGFADRVTAAGFPARRLNIGMRTLHPRYGALQYIWRADEDGVEYNPRERSADEQATFQQSPIRHLIESGESALRRRLDGTAPLEFPVLDELRAAGMTDYAARIVNFDPDAQDGSALEGVFFSTATDAPGGFDLDDLERVGDLLPNLAMAIKSRLTYDIASTVTATYLGEDAAHRVLTGAIQRGSTETVEAVIWLCDLRGFTQIADRLPRDELIALLDGYLDAMARPVHQAGGQVLKFMGDGFLATFDTATRDRTAVCRDALTAAAGLRTTFAAFNGERAAAGKPVLDFGLSLHLGEVFYGNIGAVDRLDFTVVGPAVNEASRIEGLCRPLGRDILASRTFHDIAADARLQSVGTHTLRGVSAPQELFTLAD